MNDRVAGSSDGRPWKLVIPLCMRRRGEGTIILHPKQLCEYRSSSVSRHGPHATSRLPLYYYYYCTQSIEVERLIISGEIDADCRCCCWLAARVPTRNKPIVKDVISPRTECRVLLVVVAAMAYFNNCNGAKVVTVAYTKQRSFISYNIIFIIIIMNYEIVRQCFFFCFSAGG